MLKLATTNGLALEANPGTYREAVNSKNHSSKINLVDIAIACTWTGLIAAILV